MDTLYSFHFDILTSCTSFYFIYGFIRGEKVHDGDAD